MTRIIAGAAKGRRLAVPGSGTRPTSDRAREGLFNTLAARIDLDGAHVLDLFAGTGAVGLEALSRGASSAVLVESNARAAAVLRGNVEAVGLDGARVVHSPVSRYLAAEPDEPFDLIFADPPYAEAKESCLYVTIRAGAGWLGRDGVLVVETPTLVDPRTFGIGSITWLLDKRYGETVLWYGRKP